MAKRIAISKRTRFIVLQRDGFTCQYCGARGPGTELRVDHAHPVKEGGSNDFLNLVTACHDCNAGKAGHVLMSVPKSGAWIEEEGPRDDPFPELIIERQPWQGLTYDQVTVLHQVAEAQDKMFANMGHEFDEPDPPEERNYMDWEFAWDGAIPVGGFDEAY